MKHAVLVLGVMLLVGGCERKSQPTLNLYIWSEYIPRSVLEKFTEQTGVKVNVVTYDSNEALLEKLLGGAACDVCVPSDYMVKALIERNLIQPIDRDDIPNLKHVAPRFLNRPFDRGNRYTVPYLWGTTGLGYDRRQVEGPVESWQAVLEEKNAGKILMLEDMRECFAVALKSMGRSLNERDPEVLKAAGDLLKKQKKLVKIYNSTDYDTLLRSGEVALAQGYNGQLAKLAATDPTRFAYVIPREGCTVSMDAVCITTRCRDVDAAHAFLDFIHDPQINAEIVNAVNYASTNLSAMKFIRPEILSNPWIYPPDTALQNCEFMEDLGPAMDLVETLWAEIRGR